MTYYTNSNQIKELITSLTNLEVRDLGALESLSDVTVLLFDNLSSCRLPEYSIRTDLLLRLRPDWMGTIFELMKKNRKVYLHCGEWCRALHREDPEGFRFVPCNDPVMIDDCTCLIATQTITSSAMLDALKDLLEPIRFGEGIAIRLGEQTSDLGVKPLLTFDRADYKYMCLKLEELVSKTMHQRDTWKDRFFYKALEADSRDLCSHCKEDMRKAFYDKGDEEAALKWRPGDYACGCTDRKRCKDYSWESFEDAYLEDYARDIKVEEFVSDISSDEEGECNASTDEECECNDCSFKREKANEQSDSSLNQ